VQHLELIIQSKQRRASPSLYRGEQKKAITSSSLPPKEKNTEVHRKKGSSIEKEGSHYRKQAHLIRMSERLAWRDGIFHIQV